MMERLARRADGERRARSVERVVVVGRRVVGVRVVVMGLDRVELSATVTLFDTATLTTAETAEPAEPAKVTEAPATTGFLTNMPPITFALCTPGIALLFM